MNGQIEVTFPTETNRTDVIAESEAMQQKSPATF
jgi:hypothetical protein